MLLTSISRVVLTTSLQVLCASVQCNNNYAGATAATREFHKGTLCDLSDRLSHLCSKQDKTVRPGSLVECAASCGPCDLCHGVSLDKDGNCFLHWACPTLTGCTVPATDHSYFFRQRCDNGGHVDTETESCACVDSWVGTSCQDRARECSDLITSGYPKGGYHSLLDPDQDGEDLVPAFCFIDPDTGYFNVLVLNHTGDVNFNLTWQEYSHGFYHNGKDMWLGLHHWHALSAIGYNRLFLVVNFGDKGNVYREYHNFVVHGDSDKFWIQYGVNFPNGRGSVLYAGNRVSDCFGPYQNTPFSTWDNDNNHEIDENCPAKAGFGWWFQGCDVVCNLFGWGEGHVDSKPANQILSVAGVDLDTWMPELISVYIYIHPM